MDRSLPPLFKRGVPALVRLFLCLVCALTLLIFDAQVQALHTVRAVISTVLYPLRQVAVLPRDAFYAVTGYFSTLSTLRHDNGVLRTQASAQEEKMLRYALLTAENARLRTLLELTQHSPLRMVAAEVQYETRDAYSRKIIIDRGAQHGVRPSLPVLDERGLIGQVTRVFPLQAEVTLLTDKELSVPVQIVRTGLRALVSGAAQPGYLELRFVAAGADLQAGDVLVTSGLDGVYPPGLPVATLVQMEARGKANTAFALALCMPLARLHHYRQVMVLGEGLTLPEAPPVEQEQPMRDRKGRLLPMPRVG